MKQPADGNRLGAQAQCGSEENASSLSGSTMAIRENIVTPEVKANGYGAIDEQRFARADRADRAGL